MRANRKTIRSIVDIVQRSPSQVIVKFQGSGWTECQYVEVLIRFDMLNGRMSEEIRVRLFRELRVGLDRFNSSPVVGSFRSRSTLLDGKYGDDAQKRAVSKGLRYACSISNWLNIPVEDQTSS